MFDQNNLSQFFSNHQENLKIVCDTLEFSFVTTYFLISLSKVDCHKPFLISHNLITMNKKNSLNIVRKKTFEVL